MRSAPFLKKLASRLLVAGAAVVLLRSAFSKAPDPPEKSPHAEALELVFKTQEDAIRKAEEARVTGRKPGPDRRWWHDIDVRTWHVRRTKPPGTIDSTHWFVVGYFIGGDEVANWGVETRDNRVTPFDVPAVDREHDWGGTELVRDLLLLRSEHFMDSQPGIEWPSDVSTDKARRAASKVFDRLKFVGMSREDVIWILGEPRSIPGREGEDKGGPDDPIIFRFVGEKTGDEYRLEMKDNRVVEVRRKALPGVRKP